MLVYGVALMAGGILTGEDKFAIFGGLVDVSQILDQPPRIEKITLSGKKYMRATVFA
jgi:hypothetical protein